MKSIHTALILASVLLAVPTAQAGGGKGGKGDKTADPEAIFAKKDKDSDGFLSKEEFVKGKDAAKDEKEFSKKDTDGDGKLSLAEFKAEGHHKKGKGGKKNA